MDFISEFNNINKKPLTPLKDGSAKSISEFWGKVIVQNLIKDVDYMTKWYELLKAYVNEPDAVFVIRSGNTRRKNNPKTLRRGFYTKYSKEKISFVYTDNDFATYISKLALNHVDVPSLEEFKAAMINRKFPMHFNASCKEEKSKAAFIVNGKAPDIGKAGYKVSHIVDTGMNYEMDGKILNINKILELYFPLGDYDDYKFNKDGIYVRTFDSIKNSEAKEFLKAHFLRFACPLNYILTPKVGTRSQQKHFIKIKSNDIGEDKDLQNYAIEQFKKLYPNIYDEYLSLLKLPSTIDYSYLDKKIDMIYGPSIQPSQKVVIVSNKQRKVISGGTNIGKFAKTTFKELIEKNKLNNSIINNLKDKDYCKQTFGVRLPVIVEINTTFDNARYYKDVVGGKYRITNDWYSKNKIYLEKWLQLFSIELEQAQTISNYEERKSSNK